MGFMRKCVRLLCFIKKKVANKVFNHLGENSLEVQNWRGKSLWYVLTNSMFGGLHY